MLKHPQNELQAEKERMEKRLQEITEKYQKLKSETEEIVLEKLRIEETLKKVCEDLEDSRSSNSGKSVVFILEDESRENIKCASCQSVCSICEKGVSTASIMNFLKLNPDLKSSCTSFIYCKQCKKLSTDSKLNDQIGSENSSFVESCNSCLSFETCAQCQSKNSSLKIPAIQKSQSTIIAPVVIQKSQSNILAVTPSCMSLANCSLCKKAYSVNINSDQAGSNFKSQSLSSSGFTANCNSKSICDVCNVKFHENLLNLKLGRCAKENKFGLNDSTQYLPTADILQSIYYSKTETPKAKGVKSSVSKTNTNENEGENEEEEEAEISRKPHHIKACKVNCEESPCPAAEIESFEDTATETPSEIIERRRQERMKKEEELKNKQKQEAAKKYQQFLAQQKELHKNKDGIKLEEEYSDEDDEECVYIDDCGIACSESVENSNEPVVYGKQFLSMKFQIEMQNYKISKLCQELRDKSKRGLSVVKIKQQIKKEVKKLKDMIKFTMNAQKQNPNEVWGIIPVSTVSLTQLERKSYEFEKVPMPQRPSNNSLDSNVFSEMKKVKIVEEKDKLAKQLALRSNDNRLKCLFEKSQQLEDEIFVLKQHNSELKQKQKFYESEAAEFNADSKFQEVQNTVSELMNHLKVMKTQFDDIHLELHKV